MGKLTTYILMMSGLMLLFYFAGLIQNTANSTLLNLLLNPEDLANSSFKTNLFLVLEGIAIGGAIIIGLFQSNPEPPAVATFAIFIFNVFWDFSSVIAKVASTNKVAAILIFSPIMILFMVTLIEWVQKRD